MIATRRQSISAVTVLALFVISTISAFAPASAVAPATISLSPSSSAAGNPVVVKGSGFSNSSAATVTFDGSVVASVVTSEDGSVAAVFKVPPSSPGTYSVEVSDSSGGSASTMFTVLAASISLPPGRAVGTYVRVDGSGFASFSAVALTFDGSPLSTATTKGDGSFVAGFTVPSSSPGQHTIVATDSSGNSASAFFTVLTASIALDPDSGGVGATSVVTGTGFAQIVGVTVTFDGVAVASSSSDGNGGFNVAFVVPNSSPGPHVVVATDSAGDSAEATFTVTASGDSNGGGAATLTPSLTVAPLRGIPGTILVVNGSGFAAFSPVTLTYDGMAVATATTQGPGGSFIAAFSAPASSSGNPHAIVATDSEGNSASGTFTVIPTSISLHYSSGSVGSIVEVFGSGFAQFSPVTVTFDGEAVVTATTVGDGNFSAAFEVPGASPGPHIVTATDAAGNSASRLFTVLCPVISVSPEVGRAGTLVTVDGWGFAQFSTVSVSYDGSTMAVVPTGGAGEFLATFAVPPSPAGINIIRAVDSQGDTASTIFLVRVTGESTLSLACSSASIGIGYSTPCVASLSSTSASGEISFATDDGNAVPSLAQCEVSSGSCSVDLVGANPGGVTLTATYAGDEASTTVTVTAPDPSIVTAYASETVGLVGGDASFTSLGSTGITVVITGSSAPDGTEVTVIAQDLTSPFPTVSLSGLGSPDYFDIRVTGITDGSALVCFQDATADSSTTVQYWDGTAWVAATGISVTGTTVCGTIPVSALNGTNIVLGSPTSQAPAPGEEQVMVNLLPEDGGANLSLANHFEITSVVSGVTQRFNYTGGMLEFVAEVGSTVTISGTSSGSGASERWVLDSAGSEVSAYVPPVSGDSAFSITYYYYDLVLQDVSVGTVGGVSPPASLNYSTAPTTAGSLDSPAALSAPLSSAATQIWARRGSMASGPSILATTTDERWIASMGTVSWTISGADSIPQVLTYLRQYSQLVAYSVSDGSLVPSSPSVSYFSAGSAVTATLTTSPQLFWMDAGSLVTSQPVYSANGDERWAPVPDTVLATGPNAVGSSIEYFHQFFFSAKGVVLSTQWFNSGTTAVVSVPGVYARAQGSGMRVVSYSLDGAAPTAFAPTLGNVSLSVLMDGPHALVFNTIQQYQLSLNVGATQALKSVTPPTIAGDSYWYDSGTSVTVALQAVWGRADGSGQRLTGYSVNGGTANAVATTDTVVLDLPTISSPQSVAATVSTQYQLSLPAGPLVAVTPTPIPGDAGWYDAGSQVSAEFGYAWNVIANQSRSSAISYQIDSGAPTMLQRSSGGTFAVPVEMDGTHTVEVSSVVQYHLAVTGVPTVTLSHASQTHDSYFDAGTVTSVSAPYFWNVQGGSRQALTSYSLDGVAAQVPTGGSGNFTTAVMAFEGPHLVAFGSATQYLVSFAFKDSTSTVTVTPSSFEVVAAGQAMRTQGASLWLTSGTSFNIGQILWEGVDVAPLSTTSYAVSAPLTATTDLRIYAPSLRVTDLLGATISGASVRITLANGTTIVRTTGSDGVVTLPLIPLGTFYAIVSYLGASTLVTSTSVAGTVQVHVAASLPTIGTMLAVVAAIGIGSVMLRRRPF